MRPSLGTISRGALLAVGLTALPACITDTRPIVTERPALGSSPQPEFATPLRGVAVLETKVEFLDASSGRPTDPEGLGYEGSAVLIERLARAQLRSRGFEVAEAEAPGLYRDEALHPILVSIEQNMDVLARARPGKRLAAPGSEVDWSGASVDGVLVQTLTVNVGRSGFYEPFAGSVQPSTHSTRLRSSLIDLRGPVVVWGREVFFRDLPSEDSLEEAASLLYLGLPHAVEEKGNR